jgi:AcrR family transcriptional regulator
MAARGTKVTVGPVAPEIVAGRAAKTLSSKESAPARGSRNTTKGVERAKQIMEVAEQLFHERGYAETSMDDIARAAGLLKGSLYYYMDSKEDLLYRIVDQVHEVVQEHLDNAVAHTDLTPLDRILLYTESQLTYNTANMMRIAVYHHEWRRLEGDRLKHVRDRRKEHEHAMIMLLEEARDTGQIPADTDIPMANASLFAVIIWPYTWFRPGSSSASRITKTAVQFVRGGLVGPGGAA